MSRLEKTSHAKPPKTQRKRQDVETPLDLSVNFDSSRLNSVSEFLPELVMRLLSSLVVLMFGNIAHASGPNLWPQYGGPGRDFRLDSPAKFDIGAKPIWTRPLGPGTSCIVGDATTIFTMYSVPDPKKNSEGEEVIVALDSKSGEQKWEHRCNVARRKGQESYSGDPIRPQATPAINGAILCTLGYTGLLKGLNTKTGQVVWQHDLVADFGAKPVQFGFAASPLLFEDKFIVHVGGDQANVMMVRATDGQVIWKSAPAEPSYASPVLMTVGRGTTVVQITRDTIVGLAISDGKELWSYPLPKPGLTNVPTPIVLPNQRLLISGQGVGGTRLLEIKSIDSKLEVVEVWKNDKVPFFYANWIVDNDAVYGAVGQFVAALKLTDGKELWRERGQQDGNLLRIGSSWLVLRGDGRLTVGQLTPSGMTADKSVEMLSGRCWTAPTFVGSLLLARSEKELTAWRISR